MNCSAPLLRFWSPIRGGFRGSARHLSSSSDRFPLRASCADFCFVLSTFSFVLAAWLSPAFYTGVAVAESTQAAQSPQHLYDQSYRAIARLQIVLLDDVGDPIHSDPALNSYGHGVFVTETGVVLTAAHVVLPSPAAFETAGAHSYRVDVYKHDGKQFRQATSYPAEEIAALAVGGQVRGCPGTEEKLKCRVDDDTPVGDSILLPPPSNCDISIDRPIPPLPPSAGIDQPGLDDFGQSRDYFLASARPISPAAQSPVEVLYVDNVLKLRGAFSQDVFSSVRPLKKGQSGSAILVSVDNRRYVFGMLSRLVGQEVADSTANEFFASRVQLFDSGLPLGKTVALLARCRATSPSPFLTYLLLANDRNAVDRKYASKDTLWKLQVDELLKRDESQLGREVSRYLEVISGSSATVSPCCVSRSATQTTACALQEEPGATPPTPADVAAANQLFRRAVREFGSVGAAESALLRLLETEGRSPAVDAKLRARAALLLDTVMKLSFPTGNGKPVLVNFPIYLSSLTTAGWQPATATEREDFKGDFEACFNSALN